MNLDDLTPDQMEAVLEILRAARVLARAALLYPEFERQHPEVLDLLAVFVERLGDGLHGHASATAGVRSPAVRRAQLRLERPMSLVDVCQLAHAAPEAVREALRPLLALVQPPGDGPAAESLLPDAAASARTAGRAVATAIEAEADGAVDPGEEDAIDRAATEATALTTLQARNAARRRGGAR